MPDHDTPAPNPALRGALPLEAAGTRLWLRPDGTVWWPEGATLFAADLHLGKGAAFRAGGLPLPAGSSAAALDGLDTAARACSAQRVVVLGDFWHHRSGLGPALQAAVARFARAWPTTVVLGNHDRPLPPALTEDLPLTVVTGPLTLGPLRAVHEPGLNSPPGSAAPVPAGFRLAGHLHPAVQLGSRAGDRLRRPCFVWTAHELVLPAFGRLSGHWTLRPDGFAALGAQVALIAEDRVLALPGLASPQAGWAPACS